MANDSKQKGTTAEKTSGGGASGYDVNREQQEVNKEQQEMSKERQEAPLKPEEGGGETKEQGKD